MLDASTRVAAAARSGLIDLRFAFVVDHAHRWVHGSQAASTYACCEEADLASLGWISFAEKRCTDAALVLDASTRVAAAKRSSLIDLHFYCIRRRPCRCGSQTASTCSRSVCCKEADLASLGWICVAEQLYTDGALVLDASTRVAEPPQEAASSICTFCIRRRPHAQMGLTGSLNM